MAAAAQRSANSTAWSLKKSILPSPHKVSAEGPRRGGLSITISPDVGARLLDPFGRNCGSGLGVQDVDADAARRAGARGALARASAGPRPAAADGGEASRRAVGILLARRQRWARAGRDRRAAGDADAGGSADPGLGRRHSRARGRRPASLRALARPRALAPARLRTVRALA